jgi:hypothetical protein
MTDNTAEDNQTEEVTPSIPDDSDYDEEILEAESFAEALWAIAAKYDVPVTNNYPRMQNGQYLRHIGDFIGDVTAAAKRHL